MKKIFIYYLFYVYSSFHLVRNVRIVVVLQVISQSGMPDVTQDVQFNDVCDDDLDEIEGTITYTQSIGDISQSVEQSCDCK